MVALLSNALLHDFRMTRGDESAQSRSGSSRDGLEVVTGKVVLRIISECDTIAGPDPSDSLVLRTPENAFSVLVAGYAP